MDGYVDVRCIAGERFIDRVIHHLVHQVMQALIAGRSDVHRGPQANGFQTFKNLNVVAGISAFREQSHPNGCGGKSGGNGKFFGGHATPDSKAL